MDDLKRLAEALIKAKERGDWNDIDRASMDYYDAANPAVILSLVERLEQAERIVAEAKNLVLVKGRHHSEIAYRRLAAAVEQLDKQEKQ